jgi:hypothetical protein
VVRTSSLLLYPEMVNIYCSRAARSIFSAPVLQWK